MRGCNWKHNLKGHRPIWCEISWEADGVTRQRMTLGMYTSKERRGWWCFFLKSRTWTLRFGQAVECSWGIFQSFTTSNLFPSLFLSPSMTMSRYFRLFVFDLAVSHLPHPSSSSPSTDHLQSLSSISWRCRSVQVETRVVLSLSGFTHSRYYHLAPVSLADSHLNRGKSIT